MTSTASTARPSDRREQQLLTAWCLFFALALIVCVWACVADSQSSGFMFTLWADRDLHRAFELANIPQTMGPEVTGAGRTPGGFYYYLLAAILHLRSDPGFVFFASVGLGAGGLLIFAYTALTYFGLLEAIAFAVFFVGSMQLAGSVAIIWNPSFIWPFLALSYAVFARILATKSDAALPWLVLVTGLGAQIHMSLYSLLVAEMVAIIVCVGRIRLRTWLLAALMLALLLGPYFVADWAHGFPNSRQLSANHSLPLLVTAIERLPLTFACLLVTAFGLDGGWMLGMYPALHQGVALLGTSFLVVITVYHYGGSALRRMRAESQGSGRHNIDNVKRGLAVVLGVGFLIQRVGGIHEAVVARYFLILAPAALFLSTAALRSVLRRLARIPSTSVRTVSCALLMLWAATMIGFNLLYRGGAHATIKAYGILLYPQVQEVHRFAANQFGFSDDDMARNTLFLVHDARAKDSHAWAPVSPETYVSWPTYIAPWDDSGQATEACLMVMIKSAQRQGDPPDEAEVLQAMRSLPLQWEQPPTLRHIVQTAEFTYVLYDSLAGNCPRSFAHPYNLSPTESLLERNRAAIETNGVHRIGSDLYGMSLNPSPDVQLGAIRLAAKSGEVTATLYANALRGYDGNNSRSLAQPTIVFTSKATGESFQQSFFDTVGGAHAIVLPPWRTRPMHLAGGEYVVKLVAKYSASARFGTAQAAELERVLDPHFVVTADSPGNDER